MRERALRRAVAPRRRHRGGLRLAALAASAVLAVVLLLVWVRLQVVDTGYALSTARGLEHELEQQQRALALEIATFTSRRRLAELAGSRLGMGPPLAGQVVRLPADVPSVPAPPADAPPAPPAPHRLAARAEHGEGRP